MNPVSMRMVVDLPAPLGPRKPSTSPFSTVNETPFTATFGPKVFFKLRTLIICGTLGIVDRRGGVQENQAASDTFDK